MILNIRGKLKYILNIIKFYPEWWIIFLNRLNKIPLRKVKLRNGLTVYGGNKSLVVDLIYEIFIEEVYNPSFLKIEPGNIIVDIGANIGIFSLYAAKHGAAKIYSIEPFSENTSFILRNFRSNGLNPPIITKKAISDIDGKANLYLGDLDSHGLLYGHNHQQKFETFIPVNSVKLSSFFKENIINKVDFLKMDCEGSEGAIIASTPVYMWKRIEKIAIEYHNNVSLLSDVEIVKRLKSLGYQTKKRPSDELFGYIYAWR